MFCVRVSLSVIYSWGRCKGYYIVKHKLILEIIFKTSQLNLPQQGGFKTIKNHWFVSAHGLGQKLSLSCLTFGSEILQNMLTTRAHKFIYFCNVVGRRGPLGLFINSSSHGVKGRQIESRSSALLFEYHLKKIRIIRF